MKNAHGNVAVYWFKVMYCWSWSLWVHFALGAFRTFLFVCLFLKISLNFENVGFYAFKRLRVDCPQLLLPGK